MTSTYRLIETNAETEAFVQRSLGIERYAIDTEFHRERTYFPRVALIQINTGSEIVLIDPLATDPKLLAPLFASTAVAVLHAAGQDLEVFEHWVGELPQTIFDTQLAAGFLGLSTPSLASLHDKLLHLSLPKGSRLTDWLARPLTEDQLDYAASDVEHLLEIQDYIVASLQEKGRLGWATAECSLLLESGRGRRDPDEAWRRIKAVRQLKGPALGAARLMAAWREERAAELDQPVRFILSDLAIVGIAQRKPTTPDQLRSVRGVDDRVAKGDLGAHLLDLVARGADLPNPTRSDKQRRDPRPDLRPAVALVAAWTAQLAHRNELDPALLATRADIEALVRGDEDARLAHGWRADIAGAPIRALMSGDAAIAFDSSGELVLEERTHIPVA